MTENSVKVCRDPDDDHILSAALQIKADCIISGDADLLILKKYEGIPILNPSNFWKFQKLTKRLAPISGTDLWHRSLAPISGKEPKYIQAL
jgi:hypothetical protein